MTPIAETERLLLREFRTEDLDALAAMVADDEQMRFYPATRSRDEAAEWLERNRVFYDRHGYGFWRVEARATSAFLGYCGIRPLDLGGTAMTEIGWHTQKSSWNRGIATEAAVAVRDVAFARFSRSLLVALITPVNVPSRRVAEKIGMRAQGATVLDSVDYLMYVCDRGSA